MIGRRLARVAAGYALGALAASLFLNLAVPLAAGQAFSPAGFLAQVAYAALVLAGLALPPALAFIGVAEWRGHRRPPFFAAAGAASALLVLAALEHFRPSGVPPADDTLTALLAIAGALGGLVYWTIAGRQSGLRPASLSVPGPTGS